MKKPPDLKIDVWNFKEHQVNDQKLDGWTFDKSLLECTDEEISNSESMKSLFGKSYPHFLSLYNVLKQNNKSSKGIDKWIESLKKPLDQNSALKGFIDNLVLYLHELECHENVKTFDTLIEELRRSNNSKEALSLIDLNMSLLEESDKTLFIGKLKKLKTIVDKPAWLMICLLYTSPSPRDRG